MHYVDVGLFNSHGIKRCSASSSVAFLACDAFNFVSFHLDDLFTREEEE
jgi:hypothetical protein